MEQKHIFGLPTKYPWLVDQNLEGDTKDRTFSTIMHDQLSPHCGRQIPELLGRRIRGYFHGWVILSDHPHNVMWSLWNPVTSKTLRLPPLTLKDGDFESIKQGCLSSPPNNPTSVLMLTRTTRPSIVFCQLDSLGKRLRWKEMTYAKQLRNIAGGGGGFLHCLTCWNGKVYALNSNSGGRCDPILIQVDLVVKDKEAVISLLASGKLPCPPFNNGNGVKSFLRGYCKDLFLIKLGFDHKKTVGVVYLFKLDTTNMIWEEMEELKDAVFFLNLAHDCSVFYRDAIVSELGGYIHILGETGKVVYSYDVKDKTISLSCCSSSSIEQSAHLSLWECRLHDDDQEEEIDGLKAAEDEDEMMVRVDTRKEEQVVNIPLDVVRMIMEEFCVGVEYFHLRATCKHFRLAAPAPIMIPSVRRRRLPRCWLNMNSPWLLVLNKHRGIITFTDPMFGDNYFIKLPQKLIGDLRICCSRFGWLLLYNKLNELFFFNPFTKDIRELPDAPYLDSLYFSAPPTSSGCIVVGFSASLPANYFIYSYSGSSLWASFDIDFGGPTPHSLNFLTSCVASIFALNQGALFAVMLHSETRSFRSFAVAEAPSSSAQYFLVKCDDDDDDLVLVMMDEFGESVEVFKLNHSTVKWDKIDGLGRLMIYICATTCLCMEAKTPEMENKIFFPRLDSKYGKIVFYSLETRRYHTFNATNIQQCSQDFFGTKYHLYPHEWIQPTLS